MTKRRKNPFTAEGKPRMSEAELRRESLTTRIVAAIIAKNAFPDLLTPDDVALLVATRDCGITGLTASPPEKKTTKH